MKKGIEKNSLEFYINSLSYENLIAINREYEEFFTNGDLDKMRITRLYVDSINRFIQIGIVVNTNRLTIESFYEHLNNVRPYTQAVINEN